jgi:hypothetical protein
VPARFARDMIVAGLSLVFSILFIVYSRNTGHSRHMSQPAPVPPYREVERGG